MNDRLSPLTVHTGLPNHSDRERGRKVTGDRSLFALSPLLYFFLVAVLPDPTPLRNTNVDAGTREIRPSFAEPCLTWKPD